MASVTFQKHEDDLASFGGGGGGAEARAHVASIPNMGVGDATPMWENPGTK